jgi:hypothetical protein
MGGYQGGGMWVVLIVGCWLLELVVRSKPTRRSWFFSTQNFLSVFVYSSFVLLGYR